MISTARRLQQLYSFRPDFRLDLWRATAGQARRLLIAAAIADLSAQALVGQPAWWTVLFALLTPAVFWNLPARLSAAAGLLLVAQALGSVGVVLVGHAAGLPRTGVDVLAVAWWAYCFAALITTGLTYLRTPKTQMPG